MKLKLLNSLLNLLPDSLKKQISYALNPYRNFSYSQEGEDLIIDKLLTYKKTGFYIDIGAHHPLRFSNTAIFYQRGWKGINIDPMPGSMLAFKQQRKRDINLEVAISDKEELLEFNIFNESALNTFDQNEAKRKDGKGNYFVTEKIELKTIKLETILDNYLDPKIEIDFLSIDTEGFDLKVLNSNNWKKYRPNYILVEHLVNMNDNQNEWSEIDVFLKNNGYLRILKPLTPYSSKN